MFKWMEEHPWVPASAAIGLILFSHAIVDWAVS